MLADKPCNHIDISFVEEAHRTVFFHQVGSTLNFKAFLVQPICDHIDFFVVVFLQDSLLVGEDDPGTPVAAAEAINAEIRNSKLTVLPSAMHLCNIEQAEAFNKTLMDFLT